VWQEFAFVLGLAKRAPAVGALIYVLGDLFVFVEAWGLSPSLIGFYDGGASLQLPCSAA
jgi:hypothetical protein